MNNPVENQDTVEGVAIRKLSVAVEQGLTDHSRAENPKVVFMFPGQGSQYVNMGISLYRDESVFRSIVDRCAETLEPLLEVDLRSIIYPSTVDAQAAAMTLAEIRYTQPALFVIEYALAQLWQSWGLIPTRTIGHSIGEFVSGCLGGVFSLEDALRLVAIRSKMVWDSPSGAMLSVQLPAGELATQLSRDLVIAAINSPTLCVVAGDTVGVEALQAQLVAQEIGCRLLHTSHAFHSPMMDPIVTPFLEIVNQIKLSPPQIPFISSVTGDWISDAQATDPHYWATQLREPVQFALGIQTLWQQPGRILLEVGPRRTTATLARQQVQDIHQQLVISTLDDAPEREWKSLFHALRQLYLAGIPLTPNGNIDRYLPISDLASLQSPSSFVPPTTPTEITLAQIWTQVLRIEQIGIDDNFFELGGHSLSATQVISRARKAFALDIPLQTLFEQPTITGLASWLDTSLLSKDRGLTANGGEIPIVDRDLNLPLSFAQQRLWFLDRIEPHSSSYNIPETIGLEGDLDLQILQRTLDEIVAHHEVLRTNYSIVAGEAIQVINSPRSIELQIIDLQQYSATEQTTQLQTQLHQSSQIPFDLATDLMLRCCLCQLAPNQYVFLATMHHIASDGWSMSLFWQQLGQVYNAFHAGKTNPLTPPTIQYVDYAVWQRQWLSSEILAQQLSYWKQQLADVNPVLDLPTDYPRPAIQTYSGALCSIDLSPQLTTKIKTLCRQSGTTLFMTLLAAFEILMSRHSGQEDFIIASPIAGRNRTEFEDLIGFFVNTLPLNADLSGNPRFQALLSRVRQVALGAYDHQDIPFEKLIEELNPRRDLARSPLFQVLFNLLNIEDSNLNLDGLIVSPARAPDLNSKFDLTLYVKESDQKIHLNLTYNPDLFTSTRMLEMLQQFEYLLTQIVADPDRQIQSYSLVTPAARAILPDAHIPLPQPEYPPITQTFLDWADRTPSQVAITQADTTWTYQELATAAQNIAHLLRSHGVSIGDTVAVSGDRSFGLIASMLGVFLSGGVLVNLDPNLPEVRQQIMLTTANTKYLLAVSNTALTAKLTTNIKVLTINPHTGTLKACDCCAEVTHKSALNLLILPAEAAAYVFFTSGTTGTPKGVLGSHQGLAHFLNWQRETFEIVPGDRAAQLTGLSFDVVLRDIFLPLTSGATLCLPPVTIDLTPGQILPWMEQQQITILHTVPTLVQSWLLNVPAGISLSSLRRIFFAGEPLTDRLINHWRESFPTAGEIINLYGPTETTLAKCYYRIPAEISAGTQPVGNTLPQTQALVLKPDRQLCGIGEAGEIAIRTPFRTKGYLNATAADRFSSGAASSTSFAINPFRADPDDLIYHTGDRGRYLPDGTLEILGRIDRQIKIRGIRIEPGEISAILDKHPQIQATVIIAREDIPGDKRLVAYCIPKPDQMPEIRELRQFLKHQLPDYMVPSAFVMLATFPLTVNGKIDSRALPLPERVETESSSTLAPRDEFEIQLKKIWERVLGVKSIGITDNFFELGGHSLLAVRLFSEIERVWDKQLPLSTLFQAQTIEDLAGIIRNEGWSAPWSSLVKIQSGDDTKPPLFCIHPIGGNILEYYTLVSHLGKEQPVYGLQAIGLKEKQTPLYSVEAMAAHYISEIQVVQPTGPYLLLGYSFGGIVAFEIAQQLHGLGQQVALLALIDRKSPLIQKIRPSLIKSVQIHLSNLFHLPEKDRWKYIEDRINNQFAEFNYKEFLIKSLSAIDPPSPELLNLIDVNTHASENYVAKAYSGNLNLFRCQVQTLGYSLSTDLGWDSLVNGNLEIHNIPGIHYEVLKEPCVRFFAEKLKLSIENVEAYNPVEIPTYCP